mmetsp:Transcript_3545/g.9539  ORF Transcript_3545/g.9539 Transcript_3545/m.9539 type:complete len:651 (+) Transcript_3545:147-2099(+)|eukprot:CAMPEP_0205957408 /NCGR_PEP_ID=MMETSP1459-20131121/43611_1 /ASSEMBLY_ACC=CAM_ASM_001120 /TAXON_ID=41880 /ORGANISM="Pycnococcus provasolii, Strain RCC931" /LENGTH=650 /DNA_ID=CAMNT_0053329865 /DNA_START=125 /DNA_END=2077 /DNA_ORIENTATION=+
MDAADTSPSVPSGADVSSTSSFCDPMCFPYYDLLPEEILIKISLKLPYKTNALLACTSKSAARITALVRKKPLFKSHAYHAPPPPSTVDDFVDVQTLETWTTRQLKNFVRKFENILTTFSMPTLDDVLEKSKLVDLAAQAQKRAASAMDVLADQIIQDLSAPAEPHVCLLFATSAWADDLPVVARKLADRLPPTCVVYGAVASGIVATPTKTQEGNDDNMDVDVDGDGDKTSDANAQEIEHGDGDALSVSVLRLAPGGGVKVMWRRDAHSPESINSFPDMPHTGRGSCIPPTFERTILAADGPPRPGRSSCAAIIMGDDARASASLAEQIHAQIPSATISGGLCGGEGDASVVIARGGKGPHADPLPGGCSNGAAAIVLTGLGVAAPCISRGAKQIGDIYSVARIERQEHTVCPGHKSVSLAIHAVHNAETGGESPAMSALAALENRLGGLPNALWLGLRRKASGSGSSSEQRFELLNIEGHDREGGLYVQPQDGPSAFAENGDNEETEFECAFYTVNASASVEELHAAASHAGEQVRESQRAAYEAERSASSTSTSKEEVVGTFAAGALAFLCCGRGARFHNHACSVDARALQRGFGVGARTSATSLPVCGLMANGELGGRPWNEYGGGDVTKAATLMAFTAVFVTLGL